jgi:uncharacterized membrane protein YgaE (UPF0421/DUF939 family)
MRSESRNVRKKESCRSRRRSVMKQRLRRLKRVLTGLKLLVVARGMTCKLA